MKEELVAFTSGELTMEALIANPGGGAPAAVVCHPHPMYGGSMFNNVVDAILAAMWQLGYATLRFNFRGVGGSEGEHDGGVGEADDAREALAFLTSQPGVRGEGAALAGYSFGAAVAMDAGLRSDIVHKIVAVALPVAAMPIRSETNVAKQILLASGDRDSYSPIPKLHELVAKLGPSSRLEVIAGADHFFGGHEARLAAVIESVLKSV